MITSYINNPGELYEELLGWNREESDEIRVLIKALISLSRIVENQEKEIKELKDEIFTLKVLK